MGPSGILLERLASALGTSVKAIYTSLESISGEVADQSSGLIQASDFNRTAIQLREFRDFSPQNQRLTLEFIRVIHMLKQ